MRLQMNKKLSPAAQAVLDAASNVYWDWSTMSPSDPDVIAAAVLRAAITAIGSEEIFHPTSKRTEGVKWCVQRIYTLADELETQ
jgi:hypothetical protein